MDIQFYNGQPGNTKWDVTNPTEYELEFIAGVLDGSIAPKGYALDYTGSDVSMHPRFIPLWNYLWTKPSPREYTRWQSFEYTDWQANNTSLPGTGTVRIMNQGINGRAVAINDHPPLVIDRVALFMPADIPVMVRYGAYGAYAIAEFDQPRFMYKYKLYDPGSIFFLNRKEEFEFRLRNRCPV